tara:strand:+ start:12533 stop:12877 length:345 start_codon:yes stop_codon:yes gene_type:complete
MIKPFCFTWCVFLAVITQHSPTPGKSADRPHLISFVTDNQGRFQSELKFTDRISLEESQNMHELNDLESDHGENSNLWHRRTRKKWQNTADLLETQLIDWQKSIQDPILEPAYE